jgi:hypothetical protein
MTVRWASASPKPPTPTMASAARPLHPATLAQHPDLDPVLLEWRPRRGRAAVRG